MKFGPIRRNMSEARKWTIRSAKTVYRNRWIAVREYETVAPTGADAQYGLVHYNNRALGVLPIDDEGSTLLVGQGLYEGGSEEIPCRLQVFKRENKSAIIARLMQRAVAEARLQKQRESIFRQLTAEQPRRPTATNAEIAAARRQGRP